MKTKLPENFNWDHPEHYVLLIGIHPDVFSFAVYEPAMENSFFYQPLEKTFQKDAFDNFQDCFFDNNFFGLPFQKVYLLNYFPEFTYIPSLLYDKDYKEEIMDALFTEKKKGRVLEQFLKSSEMVILHKIPENIYDFFHRSFINSEFIHYSSGIISYFLNQRRSTTAQMVVNFREKELDIYCFGEDKFVLGNHYECLNANDALYYVIFTWKQLKMDQLSNSLCLVGNNKWKKDAEEHLKRYVRNVILPDCSDSNSPFEMLVLNLCKI